MKRDNKDGKSRCKQDKGLAVSRTFDSFARAGFVVGVKLSFILLVSQMTIESLCIFVVKHKNKAHQLIRRSQPVLLNRIQ